MGQDAINPYESPNTVASEAPHRLSSPLMRLVIRMLAMGLIGFVSFSAVGFLYLVVAEHFELDIFPSIAWALGVGGLGSAIFTGSEFFNYGRGELSRFLARFLVTTVAFVASCFVAANLSDWLGWQKTTYESDPWWLHRVVLLVVVFFAALVGLKLLGAAMDAKSTSATSA
jgi:hypothetical protein